MKARLRLPLGSTIRDGFDESDVRRVWRRIQARQVRRRSTGWLVVSLATISVVALGLVILRLAPWTHAGPLQLATGGALGSLVVDEGSPSERLTLADGSQILAGPQTRLDVLANDGSLFLTALRRGSIRFDVRPGGPRRWAVECGPVSVEVVGTEFDVRRDAGEVLVSVVRGVVVVRGERVPDHVQRLTAGNQLAVPVAESPTPGNSVVARTSVTSLAPAKGSDLAPGLAPASGPSPPPGRPPASPPAAAAGATLPTSGEDLVRRADAARRSGDLVLARRLLNQAIETSQGEPSGAVAALTLARLSMRDDPAGAARVLTSALRTGMPRGLEEDAIARLVEARTRSGDAEGARQAAHEYRRRFPEGARIDEVRSWVAE